MAKYRGFAAQNDGPLNVTQHGLKPKNSPIQTRFMHKCQFLYLFKIQNSHLNKFQNSNISFEQHLIIRILAKNRPKFTFSAVFGHFRSIFAQFRGSNGHARYLNVQPECYLVSQKHIENQEQKIAKVEIPLFRKNLQVSCLKRLLEIGVKQTCEFLVLFCVGSPRSTSNPEQRLIQTNFGVLSRFRRVFKSFGQQKPVKTYIFCQKIDPIRDLKRCTLRSQVWPL